MAGSPTTTAIGSVSITATSIETNALFKSVEAAVKSLSTSDVKLYSGTGVIPGPTATGQVLVLGANATGNLNIPQGYAYVVAGPGSTATLSGGSAATTIVGDNFNYTGNAAKVVSGNGNSTIVDGFANAEIVIGSGGRSTVTAGGANQVVHVGETGTASIAATGSGDTIVAFTGSRTSISALGDNQTVSIASQGAASVTSAGNNQTIDVQAGAAVQIVTDGSGDTVNIGSGPAAAALRGQAVPAPAPLFSSVVQSQAGSRTTYNVTDAGSLNELVLGTADTVNASAGISTIFGLVADRVMASNLGQVYFVGGAGTSTIFGGAANATVFASTAQVFDLGSAQGNVFVGGTGASTINAGSGGGTFFGGTAGDQYNFGTGGAQVFLGLGGADTLGGGGGTVAPIIFATGAEHMTITASSRPVTVVSFANGGSVDTSATGGNNDFFAGYGVGGNQTLIGSALGVDSMGAATRDQFVVGANAAGTPASIAIENWHAGDVFYLTGFTAADNATMDTAIANSVGSGAKGDLSFTLGDNTTITFVGKHPTAFDATTNSAF